VFVIFGASASAVGQFLLQNKNLLAPFAGAIIVLFGLHLIGLLGRIPVRSGLVVGALLAIGGLAIWMRLGENAPRLFGPAQFISVSLIFLAGPLLTRLDLRLRLAGRPASAQSWLVYWPWPRRARPFRAASSCWRYTRPVWPSHFC